MSPRHPAGQVLVIDVGTSSIRASILKHDGSVSTGHVAPLSVNRPSSGIVEFDAAAMATAALALATETLLASGPVDALGITAQRASSIVWEAATGAPIDPGIGWQDIRTTGQCLVLRNSGIEISPNQSATKLAFLLGQHPTRDRDDLRFGTVESYLAWVFSAGDLHVTDATNAAVTGLLCPDASGWDDDVLEALQIPAEILPRIVASTGVLGEARALVGSPLIAGLCGDQQASLVGQGCLHPGDAKLTFGTGGMLDCCIGSERPPFARRGERGTFPIIAWQDNDTITWGCEAVMLTAGTCIEWLCKGLQILDSPAESDALAASVPDAGGVIFVPALAGIGTPEWDFGARGTFLGISATTTRAEMVRAVLEGVAQRGADLLFAIESDSGHAISELKVDGAMSANATFASLLASACSRPVALSSVTEATSRGVGYLAGTAVGLWSSLGEAASTATPRATIEPSGRLDRARWMELRERAFRTVPALSAISF